MPATIETEEAEVVRAFASILAGLRGFALILAERLAAGSPAAVLASVQLRSWEWATLRLLQEQGLGGALPDYEAVWGRLHERLPWMIEEAESRNAEAEALLVELLGQPRADQGKALQEPRFHSQDLLDLLLSASQEAQPHDPERSEVLAGHAGALTGRLFREEADETTSALYLTRVAILRGNARRLLGKLVRAEDALAEAAHYLAWPFESWDRAGFCRILGLVRWEQGRLVEADALLRQAARLFSERYLPQEEGASRALLGLLCLEHGGSEKAIHMLQTGRAALDPGARPWLTVRAGLGLALALADIGQANRAVAVLQETWWHYAGVRDEREHVRIYWLEGKICSQLGKKEEAEQLLSAVRAKLIAEYSLPEAGLCSLDLAVLLVESGRASEVPRLLGDLETTFLAEESGLDVSRRVFRSFIAETAGVQKIPRAYVTAAAATLRRVFRFRGYRVESLPFA